jgi:hypothetical protein
MPTNLLILEPPKNNKAGALGILFTSLNMIFMPFYLKIHLIFIALLTHVIVRPAAALFRRIFLRMCSVSMVGGGGG